VVVLGLPLGCGGSSFLNPVLKIKGITPTLGPSQGGPVIRVVGSGYIEGQTGVFFGSVEVPASDIEFVSAVELRVVLPASDGTLGAVDVSVKNPASSSGGDERVAVLRGGFLYFAETVQFEGYRNFATEPGPIAGAVADFNGDARPDLVLSHRGEVFGISTVENTGSGTLTSTSFFELSGRARPEALVRDRVRPNLLTAGRIDAGIYADFAVTVSPESDPDATEPDVLTFLGRGNGTFREGDSLRGDEYPPLEGTTSGQVSPAGPTGIALADFDRDGASDLCVVYSSSDQVVVFFGDGSGGFESACVLAVGGRPVAVEVADLNGDERDDIAVTNSRDGTVSVLYGLGNRRFRDATESPFPSGPYPTSIDSGFFDSDSIRDLVVVNSRDDAVAILRGDGFGGFEEPRVFQVGSTPTFVLTSDFDKDARDDFAVANSRSDSVTLFLQRTSGDFLEESFFTGNTPQTLFAANFDSDSSGLPDIVTTNTGGNNLSLHRNLGDAVFEQPVFLGGSSYTAGDISRPALFEDPIAVVTGDFDGDGIDDAVVADAGVPALVFVGGLASGDLDVSRPVTSVLSLPPVALAIGDVNDDGNLDIAVVFGANRGVSLLLGNGVGAFSENRITNRMLLVGGDDVAIADVDGDRALDLLLVGRDSPQVTVLLGDGSGTFSALRSTPLPHRPRALTVGDWNEDGRADLAVPADGEPFLSILLGRTDGTFAIDSVEDLAGQIPASSTAADWNADGAQDLGVNLVAENTIRLFIGDGKGKFVAGGDVSTELPLDRILAADVNGDRKSDLVGVHTEGNQALVLVNRFDAEGFDAPLFFGAASQPVDVCSYSPGTSGFAVPDLLIVNRKASNIAHFRNVSY